jgi:hypothetical protein
MSIRATIAEVLSLRQKKVPQLENIQREFNANGGVKK